MLYSGDVSGLVLGAVLMACLPVNDVVPTTPGLWGVIDRDLDLDPGEYEALEAELAYFEATRSERQNATVRRNDEWQAPWVRRLFWHFGRPGPILASVFRLEVTSPEAAACRAVAWARVLRLKDEIWLPCGGRFGRGLGPIEAELPERLYREAVRISTEHTIYDGCRAEALTGLDRYPRDGLDVAPRRPTDTAERLLIAPLRGPELTPDPVLERWVDALTETLATPGTCERRAEQAQAWRYWVSASHGRILDKMRFQGASAPAQAICDAVRGVRAL